MTFVLVARGAADVGRLAERLPGLTVAETDDLDHTPDAELSATDVLVVRSGVGVGEAQLARMRRLRWLLRPGSGTDNIEAAAIARHGVELVTNAAVAAPAVAEWTVTAMTALARRIPLGAAGLARGRHLKRECLGDDIRTLRIGIWGAGPVGLAVADELAWHGVDDVRFAEWPSNPLGLAQSSSEELCATRDVHVIAIPLRPSTEGMFGTSFINAVQARGPFVVCVGRLGTVDPQALVKALVDGALTGLALDPVDDARQVADLLVPGRAVNLLITPHIAAQRADCRARADDWVATTVARIVSTSPARAAPSRTGAR